MRRWPFVLLALSFAFGWAAANRTFQATPEWTPYQFNYPNGKARMSWNNRIIAMNEALTDTTGQGILPTGHQNFIRAAGDSGCVYYWVNLTPGSYRFIETTGPDSMFSQPRYARLGFKSVPDSSVGTAAIRDSSVTAAKIPYGTIPINKLALTGGLLALGKGLTVDCPGDTCSVYTNSIRIPHANRLYIHGGVGDSAIVQSDGGFFTGPAGHHGFHNILTDLEGFYADEDTLFLWLPNAEAGATPFGMDTTGVHIYGNLKVDGTTILAEPRIVSADTFLCSRSRYKGGDRKTSKYVAGILSTDYVMPTMTCSATAGTPTPFGINTYCVANSIGVNWASTVDSAIVRYVVVRKP